MAQNVSGNPYGLGEGPTAQYGTVKSVSGAFIFIGLSMGVIGLGLIIGGLIASLSDTSLLCLSAAGLLPMGASVWAVVQFATRRKRRVLIYPEGLVHIRGRKTQVFRWDAIEKTWVSFQKTRRGGRSVQRIFTIQDAHGTKVQFGGDIIGIVKLGETIQEEVTKRLLPRAMETYNAGGSVQFGHLSLSQQGLSNGRETVPWSQIEEVKIDRGIITVRREGQWLNWANVTVSGTPNVFVFLTMANRIVGVTR
jgi:hypothetical protein